MEKPKTSLFIYYLEIIVKWRKFIFRSTIGAVVIAIIVSLLLIPKFRATTTILPPTNYQSPMFGLMMGELSSNLANIVGKGSIFPGMATPSDLYAAIMRSGRIKSAIIVKYELKKEFKVKTMTDAIKALDDITTIEVSPEGIISVNVTYKNKYLATDIANAYIEELDRFNKETAMTTGKKYRMFVEQRLKETQDSLKVAEEALRKFQEQHRTVILDIEIENAIATIAKLKSEIILREVQKGAVASFGGFNNPYVANIDQELKEFKKQLARIEFGSPDTTRKEFGAGFSVPFARLPELSLEYARLRRDVKIQEAVFELLTQQYEQAKIMEAKDTPTVQILDIASPPDKRAWPKRTAIVLIVGIISLGISSLVAIVNEVYKFRPLSQRESITYMINTLRADFDNFKGYVKNLFVRRNKE